jgi:hypothetical protein
MPFDVVSPINFGAELLPARSPFDVVLTHRPQKKVVVHLPNPNFVRLIEGSGSCRPDDPVSLGAEQQKVQQAELFSRRNELVQDRDAGSVWPALACSFLLVRQPCQR